MAQSPATPLVLLVFCSCCWSSGPLALPVSTAGPGNASVLQEQDKIPENRAVQSSKQMDLQRTNVTLSSSSQVGEGTSGLSVGGAYEVVPQPSKITCNGQNVNCGSKSTKDVDTQYSITNGSHSNGANATGLHVAAKISNTPYVSESRNFSKEQNGAVNATPSERLKQLSYISTDVVLSTITMPVRSTMTTTTTLTTAAPPHPPVQLSDNDNDQEGSVGWLASSTPQTKSVEEVAGREQKINEGKEKDNQKNNGNIQGDDRQENGVYKDSSNEQNTNVDKDSNSKQKNTTMREAEAKEKNAAEREGSNAQGNDTDQDTGNSKQKNTTQKEDSNKQNNSDQKGKSKQKINTERKGSSKQKNKSDKVGYTERKDNVDKTDRVKEKNAENKKGSKKQQDSRGSKGGRSTAKTTVTTHSSHHLARHFTGFVQHVWLPNSTPRHPGQCCFCLP